jgi:hypothetical protein
MAREFSFDSSLARKRFHPHALDLHDAATSQRYHEAIDVVRSILAKSNIPSAKAALAIREALKAAGAQQYARARRIELQRRRKSSAQNLSVLVECLEELVQRIQDAPSASQRALNDIMIANYEKYFDTETFVALFQSFKDALPNVSNGERLRDGSIWQDIAVCWEGAPPSTRNAVESELRHSATRLDAKEFVKHIIVLLQTFWPERNAKAALTREFCLRMSEVWRSMGLKVGAAYDWKIGKNCESLFEQFCSAALRAVGNDTKIARRQTRRLQKDA